MSKALIHCILQRGPKASSPLREIHQMPRTPMIRRKRRTLEQKSIKRVSEGNDFRFQVSGSRVVHKLPKLKQAAKVASLAPKPFKQPPLANVVAINGPAASNKGDTARLYEWFKVWLKTNTPIILLNVGSICILVGFTRSDMVELRSLAMTGQLMFAGYIVAQNTILWPSVAWSCLFAGVNAVKIFEILHERHVEVHMTQDQEELFVEHFMPHGITPKQFEKIENKARKFQIEKGDFLIRKGEDLDHVFLVVKGSTQAHILGRRLSAASTSRETKGDQRIGGDSGAWVGEMTFLERFGSKVKMSEQAKDSHLESRRQGLGISMYSIVAAEDCTVMSWSHSDLEELMEISTDLRAALTRAMTSSLVGKIVNLTLSRKEGMVNDWSGWLADWKHNDGASVQVRSLQKLILEEEEEEEEEDDGTETSGSLPADGEKLEELTASE